MRQYDAILKFADKATAIADATAALNTYTDEQSLKQFAQDHCLEVTIWRNSQDTTDSDGNAVHHPLSGYFILISLDHVVPALRDHPALQVAFNRDLINADNAAGVLISPYSNTLLKDFRVSPLFAGMRPFWEVL